MTISVPFSFEFRTTEVTWNQTRARITGWGRRMDGTVDGSTLMAEISPNGVLYKVRYPRRRLPEGNWDNLWLDAYTDADVERVLSEFEPVLLVPSGKTPAGPVEFRKHSRAADAWELREQLLRLQPDCDSVLAFLGGWGRWNAAEYVEVSEILHLQAAARNALTESPETWFQSPYSFPPTWDRRPEYPFFTFLTDQCEVAIRLTVTIDLLRGVKFKTCARPDCGQPFAVESRRDKKFCSRDCAHLEAVRRNRKKAGSVPKGAR